MLTTIRPLTRLLFLFLILSTTLPLAAQQKINSNNFDHVYDKYIHSVKFHVNGLVLSYPIVDLNSRAQLELTFDDLDEEDMDYIYTLVHCNADWKPSQLTDFEYLNGFNGERIRNFDFSFRSRTNYTHYRLLLPNEDVRWTKSGNYLLQVYEDTEDRNLVITRRFMVAEPVFQIGAEIRRPAKVSKGRTHQEIDFSVSHKGTIIQNPQMEVKIAVLQNGIWQTAITDIKPQFQKAEELVYDHQDKIVFPAGKEYRFLDMRSLRTRVIPIREIIVYDDAYEIFVMTDKKRAFKNYTFFNDANGQFVIENLDRSQSLERSLSAELGINYDNFDANNSTHALQGDYAYVYFNLEAPIELEDTEVYLYGAMTDWKIQDRFRMQYKADEQIYVAEVLLKQGYYNYKYVTVKNSKASFEELEGDWFETENEYLILIYYRPFGTRYDRLMGVQTISSFR